MANNFHYTAASNRVFCSQEYGNDANDGLTPDTPKKTLTGLKSVMSTTRTQGIISGHFLNELFGSVSFGKSYELIGDGITILEYPNNITDMFIFPNNAVSKLTNILIRNTPKLITTPEGFGCLFTNCTLENVLIATSYNYGFVNCTIYNSSISYTTTYNAETGNKFINSYISIPLSVSSAYYNYYNKACLVNLLAVSTGSIGTYNNYECKFKYLTTSYDTLTDLVTAYPVLNDTEGNRNDEVTFNGPQYGDYSVPSDSPLLITNRWNNYICGNAIEGLGIYWANGTTNWTISNDGTPDLEVVAGTLQLVSGKTVGTITRNSTSEIAIGALKTLKYFKYLGNKSFNSGTGVNAPAINLYTTGQAGRLPIRLTIDIKYSPITRTQGQWDAMPWWTMDINKELKTDGTYGIGSPEYDFSLPAHLGGIIGGFCLVKITLRSAL